MSKLLQTLLGFTLVVSTAIAGPTMDRQEELYRAHTIYLADTGMSVPDQERAAGIQSDAPKPLPRRHEPITVDNSGCGEWVEMMSGAITGNSSKD